MQHWGLTPWLRRTATQPGPKGRPPPPSRHGARVAPQAQHGRAVPKARNQRFEGRLSSPPVANRMLVVGWDGADWDVLDPLLAAGELPNVAALAGRGRRG